MAKHTTGPWKARSYVNHSGDVWVDCYAFANKGKGKVLAGTIATVHVSGKGKEGSVEANAKLIAAAPELLDALEEVLTILNDDGYPEDLSYVRNAKQAIAKARGEDAKE